MALYQTTEHDTDNQFDWTSIQYTIQDDVILYTRTQFDAGHVVFAAFEEGVLRQENYVDSLTSLGFVNRYITYDTSGQMTYRGTVHANDLRIGETFENSVRTQTEFNDGFGGGGTKPWSSILLTHDDAGNITSRQTTYQISFDEARVETDTFSPGVRELVVDIDQTKGWDSIEKVYDAEGDLAERIIVNDTGLVRHDYFEDGVRVRAVQQDNPGSDGAGIRNWTSVEMTYDETGSLIGRSINYDNGLTRETGYEDGQRVFMLQEDLGGSRPWDTIHTRYEQGQIAERRVDLDNGDVSLTLYENGSRAQLLQYDGDDSAPWLLRVTDYTDGRDVTHYSAAQDIPADLLARFPEIIVPETRTEHVLDFDEVGRLDDGDTILDGAFVLDISQGKYGVQGIVMTNEYGGASADDDAEAFNAWGATVGFEKADADEFDFSGLSLANASKSDTNQIPEDQWANIVTINGYNDGEIVETVDIDLTFDHVGHELNWQSIDRLELVASGGVITNEHVENAGWFSMDDLVFLA